MAGPEGRWRREEHLGIREEKPAKVNIDVGGLGVGVYDRLVEQGYGDTVNAVNFGGKPVSPRSSVIQAQIRTTMVG